jgi:hypothetical protein
MGNGRGEKPLSAGLESLAITHDERAASAGVAAFDVPKRNLPGNRLPARWKFLRRSKEKICAGDSKGGLKQGARAALREL